MWLHWEILLNTVALYMCVETIDIRTFTKDWTISRKNFTFEPIQEVARPDNKFAYGFCKKSEFHTHLECDMKLETLSESSSSDNTKICHIKFSTKQVQARIFQLDLFGNNKILVSELNNEQKNDDVNYLKYSILDMDKCSKNPVMLLYGRFNEIYKGEVIMYNETFDIIMTDKKLCGSTSTDACRVTFDQWGKRIAGPVSFPLNLKGMVVLPVQYLSQIQGFYVLGHNDNRDRLLVTRLGLDGTVTRLMLAEHSDKIIVYKYSSNNHNSFSTCWFEVADDKEVHCVQFTVHDSHARLNVTLRVAEDTLPLAVYNLPEGLLLVTIKFGQDKWCNSFEVTKVFTNGHKSSFVIDELDLLCYDEFLIKANVKDDGNEICFNFVNEEPVYEREEFIKRSMQYRSKCVPKHDIEKL